MRKKVIIGAATVTTVVIAAGAAVFAYQSMQPKHDEIFRNYLSKYVGSNQIAIEETYNGSGVTVNHKGTLDINNKKLMMYADIVCKPKIDGKIVELNTSMQLQDNVQYYRINEAKGTVKNTNSGVEYDLSKVYSKAKGTWYKVDEDSSLKAQQDSGIHVFNTALAAPSYDQQKIVDSILGKKAISYESAETKDDTVTFKVKSDKSAYLDVLKENFPNLSNPDLVLDTVFDDATTFTSSLTVTKDGIVVNEKLAQPNICTDFVDAFIGEDHSDLSKNMEGTSTPKPFDQVKIDPITTTKGIADLQADMEF